VNKFTEKLNLLTLYDTEIHYYLENNNQKYLNETKLKAISSQTTNYIIMIAI